MGSKIVILLMLLFQWNLNILTERLSQGSSSSSSGDGLVLIGNKTGLDEMNWKQVKSVFKGERLFWSDGIPVNVVLPGNSLSYSSDVASKIYGTNTAGMQKFWLSLVFQGRGKPPVFLNSEEEIIRYVSQNQGAIGFVTPAFKSRCGDYLITIKDK